MYSRVFWILFSAFQGVLVTETRSPCFLRWLQDRVRQAAGDMKPYWAEVSLRVAERVLHDHLGLQPPAWLDAKYPLALGSCKVAVWA